jgi:DNA (cytosine-5)-methyltransferase 1
LEGEGYTVGAAVLGAHSVGAPHIRQRLYWLANAGLAGHEGRAAGTGARGSADAQGSGDARRLEHPEQQGLEGHAGDVADGNQPGRLDALAAGSVAAGGAVGGLADTNGGNASTERQQRSGEQRREPGDGGGSFWSDSYWLPCRDGKHRRVSTEPALFPLADGISYKLARRGSIRPALLKGAGNAIVPQVAAAFIEAYLDTLRSE